MDEHKDNLNETNKPANWTGSFYSYVFLKLEKLSAAMYLVTDFLSDHEPLKWKLRTKVVDLLTEAAAIKDTSSYYGAAGLNRIRVGIADISSLIKIGYFGGAVSKMNFEVLAGEFERLEKELAAQAGQEKYKYFAIDPPAAKFDPVFPDRSNSSERASGFSAAPRPAGSNGQKDIKKDSQTDLYGLNDRQGKKSVRKEQILTWLKDKPWSSIAEISQAVPGCGTKTVQRELLDMVGAGILKKQGERRWSRYMLA